MQLILSSVCLALTSAVVINAYHQKKQFYPAVVYITKSNASMAVIYIQFFVIVFMFGKLLRKIFLGTLRAAEFEHLLERFWYALTETCLAFTVFRDDFNPRFVALFTVLLFLKSFHWLAEERVDFMERSPVLGWLFHIRVASLLTVLGALDYMLLEHAYHSTMARGPSVQLVFGFEYAILLTVIASTLIKYVLHAAEMQTDTPWENKAVFLLYTELVIGLIKVVLYVLFVVIMAKIYALPMFVFRPMFFTIRNFKKALSDVIMSRRAIRNMNTLYPDATPEELRLSDNICIICREDMINHSKKLPCGHIFHTTCLRSWFQRQQTCPTCRLNILRAPATNSTAMPRPEDAPAAAPPVVGVAAAGAAPSNIQPQPAQNAPGDNVEQPRLGTAGLQAPLGFEHLATAGGLPNILPNLQAIPTMVPPPPPPPPFMMPPPFPFIGSFDVPPPPMPPDLTTFTDDELKALEGNERKNVEQRIKLLRDIQLMLDAAGILMNNYQIVASRSLATPSSIPTSISTTGATMQQSSIATISNDGPSTSAAAAAAASGTSASAIKVAPINGGNNTSKSASADAILKAHNAGVKIEDLGGEEDEEHMTNASNSTTITGCNSAIVNDNCTIITSTSADDTENNELSELRKRRLKFLEERNKSTTPTD